MNKKILFLIVAVVAFAVFIGYLGESGPHEMFGFSVNIWIMRIGWLVIAISNLARYLKIRKSEKNTK